jgi:hypothetical protein
LLAFYNDKWIKLKKGDLGKGHWTQCAEKVNTCKNDSDVTWKTSKQYKGKWNSMRRKYLRERAHEDETWETKSKWPIFNKINDIIGSSSKVIELSNAVDSDENQQQEHYQK